MAELNADFTKVYVDSSETHETIVVDARTLQITKRIQVGKHPAHLTLSPNGKYLAVMAEDDNAVVFIDTERDEVVKTLPGFHTPHFLRFTPDGRFAYVANIGAHHLTRVDMTTLEIESHIALEGFQGRPIEAPDEGGFADAQIDKNGILLRLTTPPGVCWSMTPRRTRGCRRSWLARDRGWSSPSIRSLT